MNSGMFDLLPILASIFKTASLAPPCAGPHNEAIPAAMQANGLAPLDPALRTVAVDAFCSWSACRMKMRSIARARVGLTFISSQGTANAIWRKFSAYPSEFFGYIKGCPCEYLYAIAAIVGILAISR